MTQQIEAAPQVTELRLQFFSQPASVPATVQERTRLIEQTANNAADYLNRKNGLVQCNCACK